MEVRQNEETIVIINLIKKLVSSRLRTKVAKTKLAADFCFCFYRPFVLIVISAFIGCICAYFCMFSVKPTVVTTSAFQHKRSVIL